MELHAITLMEGCIELASFSVLSDSDILNASVLEISTSKLTGEGSVQDPRLGPGVPQMNTHCPTCRNTAFNCPGHFGHIRLNYPVFHPLFEKEIIKVLKLFCYRCFSFIRLTETGEIPHFTRITKWSDRKYMCPQCGATQPAWSYSHRNMLIKMSFFNGGELLCTSHDIKVLMSNFNKRELEQIGITCWPENMIISILPVIPPCCRPSIFMEDKINDDHLTVQYSEIFKANAAIKPGTPMTQAKEINTLLWRITVLFNNPSGKGRYSTNGKVIQGYRQRLAGKTGLPREHLMGKRVNQSGRTVIGAEPTLRVDQVSVPQKIADLLTREEIVCSLNMGRLSDLARAGKIVSVNRGGKMMKPDALQLGDIVHRQLQDGDIVLINRQPTLHKGSMIALRAVLSPGKTICFNLSNAKSFNADFDGDEMNIHVPQKYNEVAELEELSSIGNHILSERNGTANIVLVQDNILGLYLMSTEPDQIERHHLHDMMMFLLDNNRPWSFYRIQSELERVRAGGVVPESGKGVISLCLPAGLYWSTGDLRIERGVLKAGALNKNTCSKLIEVVYHLYGDGVLTMINNLQFMSNRWLNLRGFTVGYGDCIVHGQTSGIKEVMDMCLARAEAISSSIHHERIREIRIQEELNSARNLGMKIAREHFSADNNFNHMVRSGSKGDFFNIAQISGLLGQQYIHGKRTQGALPHYLEDTNLKHKYESRGFIRHSFLRGLDPREAYHHAVVGRSGVVATALSTSESGYMQRRIVKLTEDIYISNQGTVIDETGLIYQFYYGNGLDICSSPPASVIPSLLSKLK